MGDGVSEIILWCIGVAGVALIAAACWRIRSKVVEEGQGRSSR